MHPKTLTGLLCFLIVLLVQATNGASVAYAQEESGPDITLGDNDFVLVTVFLKHNQSINSVERRELLNQSGFFEQFPPEGVEIVDHYVMMGLGQVIVLKLPPNLLRKVHVVIGQTAWASYETEFYPTYDLREARRLTEKRNRTQQ